MRRARRYAARVPDPTEPARDLRDELALTDPVLRRGPFLAVLCQGLPLALGLASHAVLNLVDLVLIGRLGPEAIQSAHVASTWNFLPMILGQCVSTSTLARLSRRLGDGDRAGAQRLHWRAEWLMLWIAVAVGVASALPAAWQVDLTGVRGAARSDAIHYLVVSNLGCVPMFVLMQTTAAMRAAGEALVPFGLLLLANVLNLGLAVVLLFGWPALGIPSFGVPGAAYASVAARAVAAGLAIWWLMRRKHALSLRGDRSPVQAPLLRWLLADSWPQAVQIGLRASVVVVLTILVQQRFGDAAVVALGVTTRLDTVVLFASLGFANAATAYAGRAVMVRWPGRARLAGLHGALLAGAFGSVWVWLYNDQAEGLLAWFLPGAGDEVRRFTLLYFATAAWSQVFSAAALGAIGAVHGSGRMLAPLVVDLVGFVVAAAFLTTALQSDDTLHDLYVVMVYGMASVAVAQLVHVGIGRWPRAV